MEATGAISFFETSSLSRLAGVLRLSIFAGPLVEFSGDFEESLSAVGVQIGAFREVLAQ